MLELIFKGLFDTESVSVITPGNFLLCILSALIIGMILTLFYIYNSRYTKSFAATLAMLPAMVCVVIMMVNGNVGTGVAVAGAFSLVRFRSVPGTAKEIGAIFLAMAAGLIVGMGYIGYAFLCTIICGFFYAVYNSMEFGAVKNAELYKTLHITIPEELDYTDVFEPIIQEYASKCELTQVKTTNMGSLFKLTYNIKLKNTSVEKTLIDKLRCRNGNLEINISKQETSANEL